MFQDDGADVMLPAAGGKPSSSTGVPFSVFTDAHPVAATPAVVEEPKATSSLPFQIFDENQAKNEKALAPMQKPKRGLQVPF